MSDIEGAEMTDSCLRLVVMENSERLPITGDAAAAEYSEQKISTKSGVTGQLGSSNRNWNVSRRMIKRAYILTMAIIGAVLGVHQLVLLSPFKTRNYDHERLQSVQLAGAEMQVVSRAITTYRSPQLFQVGGAGAVWTTPATADFFTSWAASMSFRSGDVLRFAGGAPSSNVLQETAASYAACTTSAYLTWWTFLAGIDVYIQLIPVGASYFMTDDAVACIRGLKVAPLVDSITVPPEPARPNVNVAQRSPQIFQVGGGAAGTWTVPTTTTFYMDWASNISFIIGDIIEFTFIDSSLKVDQVLYLSYEACTTGGYVWYALSSTKYQFTTAGIVYFVAGTPQYCVQGMRFDVNIYDPTTTGASPPTTPSSSSPPPPPIPVAPPTPTPVMPPTSAPMAPPTPTPVVPPTSAPVVPPMFAPTSPPFPPASSSPPSSRPSPGTAPPTPATPPPSPFGSPTTNSSSPSSSSKVKVIVGSAFSGVAGVSIIGYIVHAIFDIWKKPNGCKDLFNCCNFTQNNLKVEGGVDKFISTHGRHITPENATDDPKTDVQKPKSLMDRIRDHH